MIMARNCGLLYRTSTLLNNRQFSDVEFLIPGSDEKFYAHKVILAVASDYFEKAFYGKGEKQGRKQVQISTSTSPQDLFVMLQYLYTDKLEIQDFQQANQIYKLAKTYQIQELQEKCSSFFVQEPITVENLMAIYEFALQGNIEKLNDCRNFIQLKAKSMLIHPTFYNASESVILDVLQQDQLAIDNELDIINAILKWGWHECRRKAIPQESTCIRMCITPFLKFMRFVTLNADEYCDFLELNNIFTNHESTLIMRKILQPNQNVVLPTHLCNITVKRHYPILNTVTEKNHLMEVKQRSEEQKNNAGELLLEYPAKPNSPNHDIGFNPISYSLHDRIEKNVPSRMRTFSDIEHFTPNNRSSHNRSVLKVCPINVSPRLLTFGFALEESEKGLSSAFEKDFNCSAEMKMLKGAILIHGLELSIKNRKVEEILEVFLCLTGFSDKQTEQKYEQKLTKNIFSINFTQPIKLNQNEEGKIEVTVESLRLDRCNTCRIDHHKCELNNGLDVKAEISLSSNQGSENGFYFLISRIIYSIC